MSGIIDMSEPLFGHVGIYLCRRYIYMAEKFLHGTKVRSRIQHVCGKRMAKRMRRHIEVKRVRFDVLVYHPANAAIRQRLSPVI